MRKQKKKNQRKLGYTLVEVVLSIVLMGIIAGIFVATIVEGSRTYAFIESQNEASFTAKFALRRILLECRNASQIYSADATSISFLNSFAEEMEFNISGSLLSMSDDGGTNFYPLCENATTLAFDYFDNQNNLLAKPVPNPGEIQSISIMVETEKNGVTFPVKGKIYLRTKPK